MAGFPPAGTYPISNFDDPAIPPPELPPIILADAIADPKDGSDYLSLTRSGDPLEQHVRHSFATERDSGVCARDHGHRFRELRHTNQLTPEIAYSFAQEALQHLIDAGYLELLSAIPDTDKDEGFVHIIWKNRITGERQELDVL